MVSFWLGFFGGFFVCVCCFFSVQTQWILVLPYCTLFLEADVFGMKTEDMCLAEYFVRNGAISSRIEDYVKQCLKSYSKKC